MQASSACSRASVQFARAPSSRRAGCRAARLVVQAKVDLQGGPRKIRGKCFVTKDVSLLALLLCCGVGCTHLGGLGARLPPPGQL